MAELDVPHPRDVFELQGHEEAEAAFEDARARGRLHHAWLLTGPEGIGKATFAYRAARRLLGAPADLGHGLLGVDPAHPVSRQVMGRAHPDLLVLERIGEDGKPRKNIPVDDARKLSEFFSKSPAAAPHRVAIIDAADDLNVNAANALLKTLEEPPPKGVLLMVTHSPGRLLPTIRSRCRRLMLRPLGADDVARAAADALDREAADPEIEAAAAASDGSVARALDLIAGTALQVRERVNAMLAALPAVNPRDLHALGDALGRDETAFTAFVDAVRDWLSARITVAGAEPRRLDRMAEVWEKLNATARDVLDYNLERKPLVFNVFGWLAAATRG
jgi:DNA polymerase-3 subunit delta'